MLEENVNTVTLWFAVQTQWRVGLNGPTGLDYSGVEAAARMLHLPMDAGIANGIMIMEQAYLAILVERKDG